MLGSPLFGDGSPELLQLTKHNKKITEMMAFTLFIFAYFLTFKLHYYFKLQYYFT